MSTADFWKVMWHVDSEVYGLMPDHVEYPAFGEKGFKFKTVTSGKVNKEDCQKYIELCWGDMTPKQTQKDMRAKGCKFTELTEDEFSMLNRPMSMDEFRVIRPDGADERARSRHRATAAASMRNTPAPAARVLLTVEAGTLVTVVETTEDTGDRALVETEVFDRRVDKNRVVMGYLPRDVLARVDEDAAPEVTIDEDDAVVATSLADIDIDDDDDDLDDVADVPLGADVVVETLADGEDTARE